MKITLVCSLLFVLLGPSYQQCLTPNDQKLPDFRGRKGLYVGEQQFTLEVLKAVTHTHPNENVFFSPYSTFHALLIAYFISAHQTEEYLKRTLHLDSSQSKSDIYAAYKLDKFQTITGATNNSYEFTNANRIYITQQVTPRECMINFFGDELVQADFQGNPEAVRTEINQWVEKTTHDMIKDLLPLGSIDKRTNLVLVNAAYFKGKWENKFVKEDTQPEVFHISPSKQTLVDMMHIDGTFNYDVSEALQAHILELPYEGGDISMFIFLPPFAKKDNIDAVILNMLMDVESFKNVFNGSLQPRQVDVSLPKFTLEQTLELTPILNHVGVGDLFNQEADFSVLTGTRELSLGEGVHKAKIEVTEEGTKAAAATALFSWRMLGDEPTVEEFRCDRPFLFMLFNKLTNTVMFSGLYRKPPTA